MDNMNLLTGSFPNFLKYIKDVVHLASVMTDNIIPWPPVTEHLFTLIFFFCIQMRIFNKIKERIFSKLCVL